MAYRKKPKRKAGMGYILILLLILIVFAVAAVFISRRFAPSKASTDLNEYYNMTAQESTHRPAAGNDDLAIVLDNVILDGSDPSEFRALRSGDGVFVSFDLIREKIDNRFYQDKNEGLIIFTNAVDSYITAIGSTVYSDSEGEKDTGYVIARETGDKIYLNMAFAAVCTGIEYDIYSNPSRLIINIPSASAEYVTCSTDVMMRSGASKKSSVVFQEEKNSKLKVIDQKEGWLKVIDGSGLTGYVQSNFVSEIFTETSGSAFTEPEYTHILLNEPVNMVWHGIYYYESNQYVQGYTANMKGVNVISPTWFLFADDYGNILTYADYDYVNYAHDIGCSVWAMLEDMDGESCQEIIPYTSCRQTAISQMIDTCLNYGIDGINVDLETVTSSIGEDFIQFIRELSVQCRKNGLVLSVADYAPYSYNAFRHTDEQSRICDYVAIMAYDDYVGADEAGPNAGIPFVTEVMNLCTTTVDMSRLIVGIPFYTRVWYEYSDGTLGRDTVDMHGIEDLEWQHGLTYEWLEDVGYDYSEYETDGTRVRLWYENARSLEEKLKVIQDYNVAGIASWRLGQETDDIWDVLEKYY